MFRLRANCRGIPVVPNTLDEVISVTPAIWPNCFSSGAATADAMISGLAPGNDAPTEIVGESTWGRGPTGNNRKAPPPASAIAVVNRVVATGRLMNIEEKLMTAR